MAGRCFLRTAAVVPAVLAVPLSEPVGNTPAATAVVFAEAQSEDMLAVAVLPMAWLLVAPVAAQEQALPELGHLASDCRYKPVLPLTGVPPGFG